MHLITAYVRPNLVRKVESAVAPLGVSGLTLVEVKGMGEQGEHRVDNIPKVKIEMVVPGEKAAEVIRAVMDTAHTGQPGDGIITSLRLEGAWRIRTKDALKE